MDWNKFSPLARERKEKQIKISLLFLEDNQLSKTQLDTLYYVLPQNIANY